MDKPKIKFYKNNPDDKVWWVDDGSIGTQAISFNRKKIYYLFRDVPYKLSPKQLKLFCDENPYWAEFFSDRIPVIDEEELPKPKITKNKK